MNYQEFQQKYQGRQFWSAALISQKVNVGYDPKSICRSNRLGVNVRNAVCSFSIDQGSSVYRTTLEGKLILDEAEKILDTDRAFLFTTWGYDADTGEDLFDSYAVDDYGKVDRVLACCVMYDGVNERQMKRAESIDKMRRAIEGLPPKEQFNPCAQFPSICCLYGGLRCYSFAVEKDLEELRSVRGVQSIDVSSVIEAMEDYCDEFPVTKDVKIWQDSFSVVQKLGVSAQNDTMEWLQKGIDFHRSTIESITDILIKKGTDFVEALIRLPYRTVYAQSELGLEGMPF